MDRTATSGLAWTPSHFPGSLIRRGGQFPNGRTFDLYVRVMRDRSSVDAGRPGRIYRSGRLVWNPGPSQSQRRRLLAHVDCGRLAARAKLRVSKLSPMGGTRRSTPCRDCYPLILAGLLADRGVECSCEFSAFSTSARKPREGLGPLKCSLADKPDATEWMRPQDVSRSLNSRLTKIGCPRI